MGNKKTLGKPFTSDQNREKAAENGRKGGRASAKKRKEQKKLLKVPNKTIIKEVNYLQKVVKPLYLYILVE